MSSTDEPSYYEIALTNRQVVTAFVILLVCLLVAFLSGVWIGKGQLASVEGARVVTIPPDNATVEAGGKAEPLDFFEDIQSGGSDQGPEPQPPPRPGSEPEVVEKPAPAPDTMFGGEGDSPAAAAPAVPAAADRQASLPNSPPGKPAGKPEAGRRGSTAVADERPADRARREAAETPRPAQPKVAGGDPEPAAGSVIIQVFASPSRDEAEKVRVRLRKGGEKAYLSPTLVSGKTLYRVRVGPFKKRERAIVVAAKIERTYELDTWVTQ